ncbi:MAG TPA: hypothetical protein VJN94_18205 [Candidatus Binataceae bacterium]|nr:hypothetical protein [Candidatus Binataceae bacterium]
MLRAAAFGLFLVSSGCLGHSPHGVAERYVESLEQFDYQQCYKLLSRRDRTDVELHEFLTEIPLAPDVNPVWFRPVLHHTQYELGEAHRDASGTSASVPVRITTLALPLWERTLDARAGADSSPSELAQRSLDTGDFPKISYTDRIDLIKEDHRWRVLGGFVVRGRVLDQHRETIDDYHEGRLDEVIARYHSMIAELERQPGTGNLGLATQFKTELAEVERIKAEQPAAAAYAAKLALGNVAMRMSEQRVPAIFGAVTNSGDRPIDELRLAVTWYEGRGKNLKVAYREEHPIVLTPIEFTDFSQEVIPFLPGEERRFGFALSAPPNVQQDGSPYVTIASVAFSQIPAPLPTLPGKAKPLASNTSSRLGAPVVKPPVQPTPGGSLNNNRGVSGSVHN